MSNLFALPSFHQLGDTVSVRIKGAYIGGYVQAVTFTDEQVFYTVALEDEGILLDSMPSEFVLQPETGETDA